MSKKLRLPNLFNRYTRNSQKTIRINEKKRARAEKAASNLLPVQLF
jgi:hypothetical protein